MLIEDIRIYLSMPYSYFRFINISHPIYAGTTHTHGHQRIVGIYTVRRTHAPTPLVRRGHRHRYDRTPITQLMFFILHFLLPHTTN